MILALDLGTTGNRAIVFDKKGAIIASSYYEFKQLFPQPGWVEHDPEEILETTRRAIRDVCSRIDVSELKSIGITNQRETTVCWHKDTGKPIYNAIVWQCRRTAKRCESLASHAKVIKEKTGLFLDAYFSASKIEWILNKRSDLKEDVAAGQVCFGTIDTWIVWNLTAGRSHITDVSNASRTMLFNIHTLDYDDDLLALFNVPRCILPEVIPSSGDLAVCDASILGHEIPISGIIGDQQAALFTQCGFDRTRIKNTYGTGLFLCSTTGNTCVSSEHLLTTIAWQIGDDCHYALEGSVFIGGSAIQWLRDSLQLIESADETEALALSVASNEGVYFVPALSGLAAPYWDPDARGLLIGCTRGTTKAHVVRAVLESLAYQSKDMMQLFSLEGFSDHQSLRVDGGASQNAFLMQFQADILRLPVEKTSITETTALGAAGMAAFAVGFWSYDEFFAINKIKKVYQPADSVDGFNHLYDEWLRAVDRSRSWNA